MPTISSVRKPVHNKCYGIEIECTVPKGSVDYDLHTGMFYVGMDGSLRAISANDKAVEFVSQPLPYKWLDKEIAKLYKRHPWTWNSTCGIHVHVSKASVSRYRMLELLRCFLDLSDTQVTHLFGRMWNRYNNPTWDGRYCSINMHNPNTIEFRVFASGNAAWARECLRRTKLMVEYKGKYSYDSLCKLFGLTAPERPQTSLGAMLRSYLANN